MLQTYGFAEMLQTYGYWNVAKANIWLLKCCKHMVAEMLQKQTYGFAEMLQTYGCWNVAKVKIYMTS